MPNWDSNDPREFGWQASFRGFVRFTYRGLSFPQGVHPLVAPTFRIALDRLTAHGLALPLPSVGLAAGMWGQEDRNISGTETPSFHSFGLAIDVCAPWNPAGIANPSPSKYRLPDDTSALVEPLGLLWGGSPRFGSRPDRMHLECHLSPQEIGGVAARPASNLFPLPAGYYYGPLYGPSSSISGSYRTDGPYRPGLEAAQQRLGTVSDGFYGPMTAAATRSWQRSHHLKVDGLIGAATWASLFP